MNPIVPDIGMSDPHVRVFDGQVYLYCGHDDHPDDRTWVMKEWRIFTTDDLIEWRQVGSISPAVIGTMADDSSDCWACDVAERNGEFYFYYSDGKRGVGALVADNPAGPFSDPRGDYLVSPMHDPTVLVDDDAAYLVYGDKAGDFCIARLGDDMISLAESPQPIAINGAEWEQAPEWQDKNYLFKKDGLYYLSWGQDYAVSSSPYGPYTCVGAVGQGHSLDFFAHGSFFNWRGQDYHIWCRYLREGYKYRDCILSFCHLVDNRIITDTKFLDLHFARKVSGNHRVAGDN